MVPVMLQVNSDLYLPIYFVSAWTVLNEESIHQFKTDIVFSEQLLIYLAWSTFISGLFIAMYALHGSRADVSYLL